MDWEGRVSYHCKRSTGFQWLKVKDNCGWTWQRVGQPSGSWVDLTKTEQRSEKKKTAPELRRWESLDVAHQRGRVVTSLKTLNELHVIPVSPLRAYACVRLCHDRQSDVWREKLVGNERSMISIQPERTAGVVIGNQFARASENRELPLMQCAFHLIRWFTQKKIYSTASCIFFKSKDRKKVVPEVRSRVRLDWANKRNSLALHLCQFGILDALRVLPLRSYGGSRICHDFERSKKKKRCLKFCSPRKSFHAYSSGISGSPPLPARANALYIQFGKFVILLSSQSQTWKRALGATELRTPKRRLSRQFPPV